MGLTNEQIESKKQEIIDFADIGEHLYQPVKTYSSGMFARLAFACAINVEPDILIVDEVLSVGDIAFQLKCFKKFEQFKEEGKTILFVTHGVNDVLKNCTRTIILENGKKIFDGDVKTGVDKYKKIMVGLSADSEKESNKKETEKKEENIDNSNDEEEWKTHFNQNPNLLDYGNNNAEVFDYGMFDINGKPISVYNNNDEVILKSKIKFNTTVENPIFTMTVKDFQGNDITGTNTDFEKVVTGKYNKDDVVIVEFRQKIPIVPGKYTLSFSCTKYDSVGNLEVLNRKYDALLIEIISQKNTVGLVRIDSDITIHKLGEKKN